MKKYIKDKWNWFQFRLSMIKLKRTHAKRIDCNLRIIRFCLNTMMHIGVPVTEEETTTMQRLIDWYFENRADLDKDVTMYINRMAKKDTDTEVE